MKNKQKIAGFTLIELLVVIVIVGILSTISMTTFQGYFEKARVAKAQVFAKQFEDTMLREGALDEKKILTAWFKGDRASDYVSPSGLWAAALVDNSDLGVKPISGRPVLGNTLLHGRAYQDSDTPLPKGSSMRFDYNNGPWRLYGIHNPPVDQVTIATWVKYETFGGFGWNATRPVYFQNRSNLIGASNAKICFNLDWWGGGGRVCSSKSMKQDQWHHIVASYNRDTQIMRIWLDGELSQKDNVVFAGQLAIGGTLRTGYTFSGKLDEIMVSPHAFNGIGFE